MSARVRAASMLATAMILVSGVLGVQLAHGGGQFEPLRPVDPCQPRDVTSRADGIEGLTERLVLLGIDAAACRLDVSREALTLQLGQSGEVTDAQADALQEGLTSAARQMKADGSLPPASKLVDEALDSANLNRFLKIAIRALPNSVIDAALKTDDILIRTIDDLDVRAVLGSLDDQSDLNDQVEIAVTQAVKDSLVARLRDLF